MKQYKIRVLKRTIPLYKNPRKGKGHLFGISPSDPFRFKDRNPQERKMRQNIERLQKQDRERRKPKNIYSHREYSEKPMVEEHWYD